MRAGRVSAQQAIEQQGALFGTAALIAAKLLPTSTKLKMILEAQMNGLRKLNQSLGQEYLVHLQDPCKLKTI